MKAGEHIDYEQTKDMLADLLAAINTLRERTRDTEASLAAWTVKALERANRIRALEEAARDLLDSLLEPTADAMGILPERKRLAEILEEK